MTCRWPHLSIRVVWYQTICITQLEDHYFYAHLTSVTLQTTYSKMKAKGKMVTWSLSRPENTDRSWDRVPDSEKITSINRCFLCVLSSVGFQKRKSAVGCEGGESFVEELHRCKSPGEGEGIGDRRRRMSWGPWWARGGQARRPGWQRVLGLELERFHGARAGRA